MVEEKSRGAFRGKNRLLTQKTQRECLLVRDFSLTVRTQFEATPQITPLRVKKEKVDKGGKIRTWEGKAKALQYFEGFFGLVF